MSRRHLLFLSILLLLLAGVVILTWRALDFPPLRLALKYGLDPSMAPTGRTKNVEGIEFVEIGPGCFRMGSTHQAEQGDLLGRACHLLGLPWGKQAKPSHEMPVHWVEFSQGYWIARTEVTNQVYWRFCPEREKTWFSRGDGTPVEDVSAEEAERFCAWLSEQSGLSIRLPSEAEWECSCRAGSESEFCFGDDAEGLPAYAWIRDNSGWNGGSGLSPPEVATREPNAWGLFDFHGSVWEWCGDTWHDSYEGAPYDGSAWILGGTSGRVFRGGGWDHIASWCRSANRPGLSPNWRGFNLGYSSGFRTFSIGFRVAFSSLPD